MILFDIHNENGHYFLEVSLSENGNLSFSGDDYSSTAEDFFGNSSYEYWYGFDKPEVEKIKKLLGTDDVLAGIAAFFGGEMGKEREFFDLCDKNGIPHHFHSWD